MKNTYTTKGQLLNHMSYTTDSQTKGELLNHMFHKIDRTTHQDPHRWLIIASHHFSQPYPIAANIDLLSHATMDLLNQFAYPSLSGYGKFTISITGMRSYGEEITFTIGNAMPLTTEDGNFIPMKEVYANLYSTFHQYAEIYEGDDILRVMVRIYMDEDKKENRLALSEEERYSLLSSIILDGLSEIEPITAREIRHSKRSYPTHITAIKKGSKELRPFIVSDIETLIIDGVQKPYAAGLMMVHPGIEINDEILISTYFSEDYTIIMDSFEERSTKVLYDLVKKINAIVRQEKEIKTIYFHNLSRFDGILLLKHLACHHKSYKLKPLMRNHRVYEIAVYSGRKMLFRFRDSLNLLPGSLKNLANNLCPGLGPKGEIPHSSLTLPNLVSMQNELLDYMKQDILLLGGVMQKAQEIYWKLYQLDIESKITLSALALNIFRMKYYDATNWPIHIPNQNEDSFLRKAYYGGHTDVYVPKGENLYYYDVNSLYPFVMKEYPMPGGVPVWHGNLEDKDLDSMFGFLEAYVECPKTIKKPFLPYRDENNTLIFPTGVFVGVYYSEEFKYARDLGYKVNPISGYLFEKKESPFIDFVSSLFDSRFKAKKEGNEALSYVYKILMNSLYGRFGINPKSTTTEICDEARRKHFIRHGQFIAIDKLSENNYLVTYHSNTGTDSDHWNPPKNSAVQLSAAITAYARIYMYPFISREDSYYTDTDSVVLSQPLPEEVISSSVLGKFKLEALITKGEFLAPKSYHYITKEGVHVVKFKGAARDHVNPEWFESQYADPYRTQEVLVENSFSVDWITLNIRKKDTKVKLGITLGTKRIPVFHRDDWVDTEPIDINELSSLDYIGKKVIQLLRKENLSLETEIDKLSQIVERYKSNKKEESTEIPNTEEESTEVTNTVHTDEKIPNTENTDRSTDDEKPGIPNTEQEEVTNTDSPKIPNTDTFQPNTDSCDKTPIPDKTANTDLPKKPP